jgi:hypothetical protein
MVRSSYHADRQAHDAGVVQDPAGVVQDPVGVVQADAPVALSTGG